MKRALVYSMMCGMGLIFVAGCGEVANTTEKKTVTTPAIGTATSTDTHKEGTFREESSQDSVIGSLPERADCSRPDQGFLTRVEAGGEQFVGTGPSDGVPGGDSCLSSEGAVSKIAAAPRPARVSVSCQNGPCQWRAVSNVAANAQSSDSQARSDPGWVLDARSKASGLSTLLAQQSRAQGTTPRAKSVLFLFLFGGPSHLDTFDPKPDAPDECRGEFKPIDTSVAGVQIMRAPSKDGRGRCTIGRSSAR